MEIGKSIEPVIERLLEEVFETDTELRVTVRYIVGLVKASVDDVPAEVSQVIGSRPGSIIAAVKRVCSRRGYEWKIDTQVPTTTATFTIRKK